MLNTYLTQIEHAASAAGVSLVEACREEGIATTTLWRWRKGEICPREATAVALMKRIALIAETRRESAA